MIEHKVEPPNDYIIKIKWYIYHSEHINFFTRYGQKFNIVSHRFIQLRNGEDTCAIVLVANNSIHFLIATRYKKVCHTQIEYVCFAKI
jgi:hypothetical protein